MRKAALSAAVRREAALSAGRGRGQETGCYERRQGRQAAASAANDVEKGCFERRGPQTGCFERHRNLSFSLPFIFHAAIRQGPLASFPGIAFSADRVFGFPASDWLLRAPAGETGCCERRGEGCFERRGEGCFERRGPHSYPYSFLWQSLLRLGQSLLRLPSLSLSHTPFCGFHTPQYARARRLRFQASPSPPTVFLVSRRATGEEAHPRRRKERMPILRDLRRDQTTAQRDYHEHRLRNAGTRDSARSLSVVGDEPLWFLLNKRHPSPGRGCWQGAGGNLAGPPP